MRGLLATVVLLLCAGCGTLNHEYVLADEETYEAVAAEYLAYVMGDAELDAEDRDIRRLTIRSWRRRIDEGRRVLEMHRTVDGKPSIWSPERWR